MERLQILRLESNRLNLGGIPKNIFSQSVVSESTKACSACHQVEFSSSSPRSCWRATNWTPRSWSPSRVTTRTPRETRCSGGTPALGRRQQSLTLSRCQRCQHRNCHSCVQRRANEAFRTLLLSGQNEAISGCLPPGLYVCTIAHACACTWTRTPRHSSSCTYC